MAEQYRERPPTSEANREMSIFEEFGLDGASVDTGYLNALLQKRADEVRRKQQNGQLSDDRAAEELSGISHLSQAIEGNNYYDAASFFAAIGLQKLNESIGKFGEFQFQQLAESDDFTPEERNEFRREGASLARSAAVSYANAFLYLRAAHNQARRAITYGGPDTRMQSVLDAIEEALDDTRVRSMANHGFVARVIPDIPGYRVPQKNSKNIKQERDRQRAEEVARQIEITPVPSERANRPEMVEKPRLRTRIAKYLKAVVFNPFSPAGKSKAGYLLGAGLGLGIDALSAANASFPWRAATTAGLMSLNSFRDAMLWRRFFKSTSPAERLAIEEKMQKGSRFRRGFASGLAASSLLNMVAPDAAEAIFRSNLAQEYAQFAHTIGKEAFDVGAAGVLDTVGDAFIADESFGTGSAFGGSPSEQPSFQGHGDFDIDTLSHIDLGKGVTPDGRGLHFQSVLGESIDTIQDAAHELGQAHVDAAASARDSFEDWYRETFDVPRVIEGHRRRPGSDRDIPEHPTGTHIYDEVTVEPGDTLDEILEQQGINPNSVYGSVESMHDFIAQNEQVLIVGNEEGVQDFYQFIYDHPNATPDEVRQYFYDAVRVIVPGQELTIPTEFVSDGFVPEESQQTATDAGFPTFAQIGEAIDELDIEVKPMPMYSDLGERLMRTRSGKILSLGTLFGAFMYRRGQRSKKT